MKLIVNSLCNCTIYNTFCLSSYSTCGLGEVSWPPLGHDGPQGTEGHQFILYTYAYCGWWSKPMWVTSSAKIWFLCIEELLNAYILIRILTISIYVLVMFSYGFFFYVVRVCVVMWCLPECVPVSWSEAWGHLSMCHLSWGPDCGHTQVTLLHTYLEETLKVLNKCSCAWKQGEITLYKNLS